MADSARPVHAWLAVAVAAVSGFVGWAAHPPVGAGWLTYAYIPLLLTSLYVGRPRALKWSFGLGALSGAITFGLTLVWLIEPAGLLAYGLLVPFEAAFIGSFTAIACTSVRSKRILWLAPVAFTGLEAWRGILPTKGFDWIALGYAHADGSPLLGLAAWTGMRGITFAVVAVSAAGWWLTAGRPGGSSAPAHRTVIRFGVPTVALWLTAALAPIPGLEETRSIEVLAVQGNDFFQSPLPLAEQDRTIARNLADLTESAIAADGPADLVIWPEAAVDRDPFSAAGRDLFADLLRGAVAADGRLLTGLNLNGVEPRTFENSLAHIGMGGELHDRYIKRKLVPFGEYIPFRSFFDAVPQLRAVPRDGVPGPPDQTVTVGDIRVGVAICFESLFGDLVRENIRTADAELLVIVTDDESFGKGSESAQHVAQSRLRAVETGRYTIHAALSGSTAVITPAGEVIEQTGLYELATVRATIPLVEGNTPFLVIGDLLGLLMRTLVLVLVIYQLAEAVRHRQPKATRTSATTPARDEE